jgi:PKD repeat protein
MKSLFASATCGTGCAVQSLSVAVSANTTSGSAPLAVGFGSTVSGGTTPYTYAWNFGDGASSTSADPTHTYTLAGTYTARLRVTDGSSPSLNGSASEVVTVGSGTGTNGTGGPLAAPTVTVSAATVPMGSSVALHAIFSGGRAPYVCQWKAEAPGASGFADLGTPYGCSSPTLASSGPLAALGGWSFKLKVTDANGTSAHSHPALVTVEPGHPHPPPGGVLPRGAMILRDE